MTNLLFIWINFFVTFVTSGFAQQFKPEQTVRRGPGSDLNCMSPLISAQDEFPDSAFTASSTLLNKTDFQPYQARLTDVYGSKEHTSGYAWCPNSLVDEMMREWIQAEFTHLVIIKSIFTAGRGDGNVKEFMPSFVLKYQREDNGTWYEHVKRDGTRVLKANSDPRNPARATLDSVVIAKRIRIYPYSRKGSRDVCLRFALYGCKFPDGVVSYSIPQGGLRPQTSFRSASSMDTLEPIVARHLKDLSYDGQLISTTYQLTDGLGQLMDNVAFLGNLTRESDLYPSQPGFHYVGWPQSDQGEIQLLFKFDAPRHFTWIRLFTFDSIVLKVRLFSHAVIAFSMDGKTFDDSVEFSTGRVQYYNPQMSRARRSSHADPRVYADAEYGGALVIELALNERVGRFLRLTLTAADSWTVLSEVQFNSTILNSKPIPVAPPTPVVKKPEVLEGIQGGIRPDSDADGSAQQARIQKPEEVEPSDEIVMQNASPSDNSYTAPSMEGIDRTDASSGKLVALLPLIISLGVLLFLLPIALFIWLCSRRHLKRKQFKCRQKLHPVDGDGRTMLRNTPAHILTASNIPEGVKLLGSGNTQLCFLNGTHPPNLQQRLHDHNMNKPYGSSNMMQTRNGNPGAVFPGQTNADSFDATVDTPQIYSSTDANYMSPEYASASIFEFPVNNSESPSVVPSSGLDTLPTSTYHPTFSIAHGNPTLVSGPALGIYSGPASMPLGTGTLQLPLTHNPASRNQGIQSAMSQNPAGLMFVGGVEDMGTLYQAVQANAYNFSLDGGRPCAMYPPDPHIAANGALRMQDSTDPWLLMASKQGNLANGSGICAPNATWFGDSHAGTIQMLPAMSHQFSHGQGTLRMGDFPQFTPQLSPQHYIASQPQQPFRPVAVPSTTTTTSQILNADSRGEQTLSRGSPVGAAATNVTYLPNGSEATSRDTANSGHLSIYSVCT